MRVRVRPGIAVAAVVVLLAGGGAAYVVTSRHDIHPSEHTALPPRRALPMGDVGGVTLPTRAGVSAVMHSVLARTGLGPSTAGLVLDASTGARLFAREPAQAMTPASTLKLLTAAAALTVLGPNETLTTEVVRSNGTIYLVGGGDVTLTATRQSGYPATATLHDLAARTAAALGATTRIRLRYDAGGWSGPTLAAGWTPGYLASGNVSRLMTLELDEARLTSGPTAPRAADPARQAADAFRRALTQAGVDVVGPTRPGAAPPSAPGIAAVNSPRIAALVQRMLTTSDNDLAEALGRTIAAQLGRPATFTGAASAVRTAVGRLGVPTRGLRLYDASGLSRLDRVSPVVLVALLRAALADEGRLGPLLAGLPVAGFTGTLADRYATGSARVGAGLVRAKTGTLEGVNALAGQVVDADGRLLVFAFLADHVPDPAAGESALDRLAATLARCGCTRPSPHSPPNAGAGHASTD